MVTYLGNAADVLVAVLLREAQVLVQAEADIVAVEAVGGQADVEEVLLQRGRDRRLARGRQPREPDGEAPLAAQLVPLVARERRVPGDVAALRFSFFCPLDLGLTCDERGLLRVLPAAGWWGRGGALRVRGRRRHLRCHFVSFSRDKSSWGHTGGYLARMGLGRQRVALSCRSKCTGFNVAKSARWVGQGSIAVGHRCRASPRPTPMISLRSGVAVPQREGSSSQAQGALFRGRWRHFQQFHLRISSTLHHLCLN